MATLKVIRRRIATTKNTQKITRAMKLVAAARLRRAQQRITELRPYAEKTREVLRSVASRMGGGSEEGAHPLLVERPVKKVLLLVLTSDRGLAGAFNSSIQRAADRQLKEFRERGHEVTLATVGRKGRDFFRRRSVDIRHDFTGIPEGNAEKAQEIARTLTHDFIEGEVDEVWVIFNEFKSAMTQKVVVQRVLPIPTQSSGDEPETARGGDYIFEPSREALLDRLLPMYVEVTVFRALLDSWASEHGARMTAMDSATNNAKKMIAKLTLDYNRARQAAITKELMEIIGGAEALKD